MLKDMTQKWEYHNKDLEISLKKLGNDHPKSVKIY